MTRHPICHAGALFGGALFAAGIAHGQEFQYEFNAAGAGPTAVAFAYGDDAPGVGSYGIDGYRSYSPATAFIDAATNYNGFGGTAHTASSTIGADAFAAMSTGSGGAICGAYGYFSVPAGVDLLVEWDFSNETPSQPFVRSSILIRRWDGAGVPIETLLQVTQGDAATGTHTVPLTPGVLYSASVDVAGLEPFGGASVLLTLLAPACPADIDGDGDADVDDIEFFVDAFIAGVASADIDNDGDTDVDDIEGFVDAFLEGC